MNSRFPLMLAVVALGALGCSGSTLTDLHGLRQDGSNGSIPVRPAIDTVGVGASVTFAADVADSTIPVDGWTLSDSGVASIVDRGQQWVTVKALDTGTVVVTANKNGQFGKATLVVLPSYKRDSTVVRITTSCVRRVAVDSELQIGFNGWDAYDDVIFGRPRTITVGDSSIARIDSTAETYAWLHALKRGATAVRIVMERATTCVRVVVGDTVAWNYTACGDAEAPVAAVSLTLLTDSIQSRQYPGFAAVLKDAAGNVLPCRLVDWSSSDTTVLTIYDVLDWSTYDWRNEMYAEVHGPGTATITAWAEGRTASMTMTFH